MCTSTFSEYKSIELNHLFKRRLFKFLFEKTKRSFTKETRVKVRMNSFQVQCFQVLNE